MALDVPEAVAAYLAAEEAKDADALSRCFTEDGTVHDEGGIIAVVTRSANGNKRWTRNTDVFAITEPCAQLIWAAMDLYAFSRLNFMARLGYPLARTLQKRFARDSKTARQRAVADSA
jgi:ABC-type maltose transport system permease subunit